MAAVAQASNPSLQAVLLVDADGYLLVNTSGAPQAPGNTGRASITQADIDARIPELPATVRVQIIDKALGTIPKDSLTALARRIRTLQG